MNSRRKRGKKMSAKKEIREIKRSKGSMDYCYSCTLHAENGSKEAIQALNCSPKKALEEIRKIAPKLEERKRTLWNRVQVSHGSDTLEFWECTTCGRIAEAGKSEMLPSQKDAIRKMEFPKKK